MRPLRLIVVGTAASNPYAGMAWMHMQIVLGLRRLGHDAYYFELTRTWPYDPKLDRRVSTSAYPMAYLSDLAKGFDLEHCWAYRRSYTDGQWFGLSKARAEELLAHADAVFNVAGATQFYEEDLDVGRLVYFGTDPVIHEIGYRSRVDFKNRMIVDEHDDVVTYGENIGTERCPLPPLPTQRARTRQPVVIDLWADAGSPRDLITTVGNWKQEGRDVVYNGETYHWSKHHEFLKFLDLPLRTELNFELAMNLADPRTIVHGRGEEVRARGLEVDDYTLLLNHGWLLADAREFTTDPWSYRDYIRSSKAEFTVARDLNVRLRSGWFSERSACYLAAGRPVITQDTGFSDVLPTGEGLFAVTSLDEAAAAVEAVTRDPERHSRAARDIAEEYFRAERVLGKLLEELGL